MQAGSCPPPSKRAWVIFPGSRASVGDDFHHREPRKECHKAGHYLAIVLRRPLSVCITVGKRNYFAGYGILLHELPVVVVLITQSNNNEETMKNSIGMPTS